MSIKKFVGEYFTNIIQNGNDIELKTGIICWIPIMENDKKSILEVKRNPYKTNIHDEVLFDIVNINNSHYKNKNVIDLPIKDIQLDAHQELLISRSKKRPCLILDKFKISKEKINTIQDEPQKKLAHHFSKALYIAAPLYSCSTIIEPGSFGPEMTYRIEHLLYNHFFYLPPFPKNTKSLSQLSSSNGGIVRLDESFSFMKNNSIEIETTFMLSEKAVDLLSLQTSSMFLEHDNYMKIKDKLNTKFYDEFPHLKK